MNELKEIYDRITFLRGKGIKMKEMAEQAQLTRAYCPPCIPQYSRHTSKMWKKGWMTTKHWTTL